MQNKNLKKFLIIAISTIFLTSFSTTVYATDPEMDVDWINITKKLNAEGTEKVNQAIQDIWSSGWKVWEKYNKAASWMSTPEQMASWIMNRNTIMNYLVYIVQFLSQLGLLIWAIFIMYAGYKYIISALNWWRTAGSTLKNAIIWIIIVIFSYAIMRILTSFIWLT